MGIIERQSLKYTAVNMIGVLVGVVSTLFIYPRITSEFGFIRYLQDMSLMVLPVLSLGMSLTAIKFYPDFKDENNHNHGFLGVILGTVALSTAISCLIAFCFWGHITSSAKSGQDYRQFLWFVFPYAIVTTVSSVLYNYTQNHHRIALPSFLMDVLPKFLMPIILMLFWKEYISFENALWLILCQMLISATSIVLFIRSLGDFSLRIDLQHLRKLWKPLFRYAGFVTIFGLAFLLATRTDVLFLGSMTSFATTGAYAIVVFMVSTIEIPTRGLYLASNAKIPAYWAENNIAELQALYRKVTINLVAIGTGILALLFLNFTDLVAIMPNGKILDGGLILVVLLGLAKLADSIGGMSHAIVYFSSMYKWSLLSLCILAVFNILLSLQLVPKYGAQGAAITTCVSVLLFNLFAILFCKFVWGISVYWPPLLKLLGIGLATATLLIFLPLPVHPVFSMAIRSMLFIALYGGLIYRLRLTPDLIGLVEKWGTKV
jgi:O-antigen/teichoic acid export membrane protein